MLTSVSWSCPWVADAAFLLHIIDHRTQILGGNRNKLICAGLHLRCLWLAILSEAHHLHEDSDHYPLHLLS